MRANNMRRSNYIVAGKRLKIPRRGYMKPATIVMQKPRNGQAVKHVVRKGDSLYIIAKQYGTTTKKIQELNNLKTTTLYKRQVLTIFPSKSQKPPTVEGLATYEVRAGDSPFKSMLRFWPGWPAFIFWRSCKKDSASNAMKIWNKNGYPPDWHSGEQLAADLQL